MENNDSILSDDKIGKLILFDRISAIEKHIKILNEERDRLVSDFVKKGESK